MDEQKPEDNFSRFTRLAAGGREGFRWSRLLQHLGHAGLLRKVPRQYRRPEDAPPAPLPDGTPGPARHRT